MTPAARTAVLTYHKALRSVNLFPAEAALLVAVADAPGSSLSEIAEILEVTPPVISKTKGGRNLAGLLVEDQADGRTLRIRLSDKGKDVLDRLAGNSPPDEDDDL